MENIRRLLSVVTAAALAAAGLTLPVLPALAAEEVYPAPASGAWTVDGRAYGHGRGLSQWGSQAQALQGRSAAQILDFYYEGTQNAPLGDPFVTVALTAFTPTTTVTVWSPENRPIRMGPIAGEEMRSPGRWTVTVSDGRVTAQRRDTAGGPVLETLTFDGVLRFESLAEYGMVVAGSESATEGRWYRGDLRVSPTGGNGFNVTNTLPMEQYLRSVVPRESPASWQQAALQAQSVAARTYAWWKIRNGSTLCDTTSCQVYYGRGVADAAGNLTRSYEDPRTDTAIAATAGQIRTYGGDVAFTEFSSSNGGWTTAGNVPYQTAKPDPWTGTAPGDTVSVWSAQLPVSRVAQSCPGTGGTVRNLVVVSRTGNGPLGGRITQARVECTTGTASISSPAFGLRSSWWRPRPTTPVLENPAISSTVIDHAGQVSIGVTPNVGLTWTLTVQDRTTGAQVLSTTGSAVAGVRFNATWFGTWAPVPSGTSPYVGPGVYDLTLVGRDDAGATTAAVRYSVEVRRPADPPSVAPVPLVGDGGYVPLAPVRLVDTRTTFQALGPGQRADVLVLGRAGVPASGVTAVALNVTSVHSTRSTHLRVWPSGAPMPNASSLNTDGGRTQASMVVVGVGGEGKVSLYNAAGTTHYIVDVLGYWTTSLGASARYTPVTPVRAFDSRAGAPPASGVPVEVDVAGILGVGRSSVGAVTVNLTTTASQGEGYVVAYGAGTAPGTSSVNLSRGSDVANRATVPVVDGRLSLQLVGGPAHVVVDVVGWFGAPGATSGALFTPVQPTRLLDTRAGGTPFGEGETRALAVTGGVVPPDAVALAGTLTATDQTSVFTHARLWPAGLPLTPTSDLNSGAGRTQANAVVVRIGAGGAVQLYNDRGRSALILDVVGFYR